MNHLRDVRILKRSIAVFQNRINCPCSHPRLKVIEYENKNKFRRRTLKMVKYEFKNLEQFYSYFEFFLIKNIRRREVVSFFRGVFHDVNLESELDQFHIQ